ncbi:hypothetical protein ACHAXN_000022, partial [Cyclotella atomus]
MSSVGSSVDPEAIRSLLGRPLVTQRSRQPSSSAATGVDASFVVNSSSLGSGGALVLRSGDGSTTGGL